MLVYRLSTPIDEFDDMLTLQQWQAARDDTGTQWVLQAMLALADAQQEIGWRGDMRHLPSIGQEPEEPPYLAVKQDDNGTTFLVTTTPARWMAESSNLCIAVPNRRIGNWTHPTREDLPEAINDTPTTATTYHTPF